MSAPVDVTGGSGGITANRESIEHLATLYTGAASGLEFETLALAAEASALGSGLFAGDYGSAGRLDPAGLLVARTALDDAVATLRLSTTQAGELGTRLRWAAGGYPWGSSAFGAVFDQISGLLRGLGRTTLLGPLGVAASGGSSGPTVAGQDPDTVDAAVDLFGLAAISELVSGDGDGLGVAIATGTSAVAAPRRLSDVIDGLAEVNRTGTPGGIDVRVLTDREGRRHAVVDITGTRVWKPGGRNPADLTTNTRALGGHNTAYSQGVVAALRQAGVQRDEPVMLVGHSQGGMVAITTASDLTRTGEFTVTHVITAGSPIGSTAARLPASVRVLALENSRDAVPRVDGRANPDRPTVTTVSGAYGNGSAGDSHSLDSSYRPLARDAERSGSRSVREFLRSARGFFGAGHAEQHTYRVERR